jgi:protein-tyrosine-phosphatase
MSVTPEAQLQMRLAAEVDNLLKEFGGTFDRETIEDRVRECAISLVGSHVPIMKAAMAGRFARDRLRAQGQVNGTVAKHVPELLFVCGKDAGRSQMAAAFANILSGGRVHAASAGEHHAHGVHPTVLEAMRDTGIDLTNSFPKPVADEVVHAADIVITMGCGENTCPYYPGKQYRDWEVVDPAGKPLADVLAIRDGLRGRVVRLLQELHAIDPSTAV